MTARGYIRPIKRLTEAGQLASLLAAGIEERSIYVEGRDGETLGEAVRALRTGDSLAVVRLHLLAPPREPRQPSRRRALWATIAAIEAAGAVVVETDTSRSSVDRRDAMIADAIEWLSGQSRGAAGAENGKFGRPPAQISDADRAAAQQLWFDRTLTNREVRSRLPHGVSVDRCYRIFGARHA